MELQLYHLQKLKEKEWKAFQISPEKSKEKYV